MKNKIKIQVLLHHNTDFSLLTNNYLNLKPNYFVMKNIGQTFTVTRDSSLLKYLFEILPGQSRTSVKNILSKGQVLVNNVPETAFDKPLFKGDSLVILPKVISMARESRDEAFSSVIAAGVQIVFEDDHLLVVDKPSGLATIATGNRRKEGQGNKKVPKETRRERTLYSILYDYVRTTVKAQRKEEKAMGLELDRTSKKVWIVHRIDRGTSGLVLFAKDERTKDLLQSKWKESVNERKYTAYLEGVPNEPEGTIESWLTENPKSLKMSSSPVERKDSQHAVTHYRTLGTVKLEKYLFTKTEFSLETGRKNQIRVHMHDMGNPVSGDRKYGGHPSPINRVALHATTLSFVHPITGQVVTYHSPAPPSFTSLVEGTKKKKS